MAKVKFVGKGLRMVAGKFMSQGDVHEVNPKIAQGLVNNPDFVITWNEGEGQPPQIDPATALRSVQDELDEVIADAKIDVKLAKRERSARKGKKK